MKLLSTGQLVELIPINKKTIDNWCHWGIISPTEGGSGKGDHRRFSVSQAVAISAMLGFADLGIPLKLLKSIHDLLEPLTVDDLLRTISFGYRAVEVSSLGGARLIAAPEGCPNFARLDLTLYRIQQQLAAMDGQQSTNAVGASRI